MTDLSNVSDGQLISDLKNVAELIGRSPTQQEYDKYSRFSYADHIRRFGSWNKAKEKAGLKIQDNQSTQAKISIEDLLEELNKGLNFREIGEKYGYYVSGNTAPQLTQRANKYNIKKRNTLSKNSAAYSGDGFSGIVSVPKSVIESLDIPMDPDIPIYYNLYKVGPRKLEITIHENRAYIDEEEVDVTSKHEADEEVAEELIRHANRELDKRNLDTSLDYAVLLRAADKIHDIEGDCY